MKKTYVGIDVSKGWLDISVQRHGELAVLEEKRVNNDFKGISKMCSALAREHGRENLWFCFEHTGNYGLLLSCVLEEKGIVYSSVPALEIKKSIGMARGKSDKVDAARISGYAATNSHRLRPSSLPSGPLLKIRQLLTYRGQLVKNRTQYKNSLKSHILAGQVVPNGFIVDDIHSKIEGLDADIAEIERQALKEIENEPGLKGNYRLATSVKGIGLVAAAYMLVSTNNFEGFASPRKFNCYTGVAPFETSSGTGRPSIRTSNLANKTIKTLLFNSANSAARYDPQLKKYYERKRAEGKAHKLVMNAIACKLIYRVFATVKRQSEYVVFAY